MRLTVEPLDPARDLALLHAWVTHPRSVFWGMQDATPEQVHDEYARIAADPNRCQSEIEWGMEELRVAGFDRIDYLAVCDAASLKPLDVADRPARVLAAAFVGRTRLIDNVAV